MKFLPSDKFEIETTLSPTMIVDSLHLSIEPKKLFRMSSSSNHKPFQGEITQDGFKITRIIHYRNSFLPIITGRFLPGNPGLKVEIRMGLHPFVIAFMSIWFGGVGLFCTLELVFGEADLWMPMGMVLFGIALVSGGFWFEAKKQKPMLIEMFKTIK